MFQILWNLLAYKGVLFSKNILEHKHIILVNTLSIFITIFNILLILIMNFFFDVTPIFLKLSIISTFLIPIVLFLNSLGKLTFARIYLFFVTYIYILVIGIIQGNQTKAHYFFLAEALLVFFIFPTHQKKIMLFITLLSIISFGLFDFYSDQLIPLEKIPIEQVKISNFISSFSFALILISFSFHIFNTFEKTEISFRLEFDKSERLLQNILPDSIIKKLRENPDSIAERYENCTVLFSDIVGFTGISKSMSAVSVVSLLNDIFSKFDDLAEKYGLEKIKTIGDAYMIVGGLPEPNLNHAENVAKFAIEMMNIIYKYRKENNIELELRIGINSGSAVAGVIGKKKFIYDLWGDSVNTASRMESHGLPGQIQVSESTYQLLKDNFQFEDRGQIEVKGLGLVRSYLLLKEFI